MRKIILVSALAVAVLVAFTPISTAEMAKEGSTSGLMSYSGTFKALPMGQERVQMTYEVMGVVTGEGIFNNSSFRCIGALHGVKGMYEDDNGFCVLTLPDGDQVFSRYKAAGKMGASGKGTFTYVGGTGKFVGIQGGGELIRVNVRPVAEGTFQGYSKTEGRWKLP